MSTEPALPSPLEPMSHEFGPKPRRRSFIEPPAIANGAKDKAQGQAQEAIDGTGLHRDRKSDREPVFSSDQKTQSRGHAVTSEEKGHEEVDMRRIIEGQFVVWFVDHVAHNADIPHHSMSDSTADTTSLFLTFSKLLSRGASTSRLGSEVARIIQQHSGDFARRLIQALSLPSRQEDMVLLWDDPRPARVVLTSSFLNASVREGNCQHWGKADMQNAREYLMQHDALQWLLVRIRIATMTLSTGDTEHTVRTKFVGRFNSQDVSLTLDWAPREFLQEQYDGAETIRLADVFCLSGSVRFMLKEQSVNEPDEAGTCWRKLFKNPVIALGYSIPARKLGEVGLELSLHMMMVLGQTLCAAAFAGRSMLKGYNSLFVPTSRIGSSIIWHFLVNEDRSRLPYNDGIAATANAYLIDQDTLEKGRHFVGWTPTADVLAGTKVASYDIERSQTDISKPAFATLSCINLTVSKIIGAGATMVRGKKDIPAALSNQRIYEDQVSAASQWNVLLYDTYERRGWLVDGASALVHLSMAWLSSHAQRQALIEEANGTSGAEAQQNVFDQLWHPGSFDGHNTALKTLLNHYNRNIRLYARTETKEELSKDLETGKLSRVEKTTKTWWCWEHVVLEKWNLLEQVHDHLVRRRSSPTTDLKLPFGKQSIEGFEFNDAVCGFSPLQPRVTKLESSSGDWLDFSIGIDAVTFFGSKFGELIRPASVSSGRISHSSCGKRTACPTDLDYLAVPMSVLAQVRKRHRKRTDGSVQLGGGIFWANSMLSLEDCDCSRRRCRINVAQLQSDSVLDRPTTKKASSDEAFQRYPHGAVLFGQRKTVAVMITSSSQGSKSQVDSGGSSKSKEPVSDSGVDMGEASSSPGSAPDSQTTDSSAPSVVSERPQGSAHSISKSPQRRSLFWLLSFRNSRLLARNRYGHGGRSSRHRSTHNESARSGDTLGQEPQTTPLR
ncbi:hypothetical protein LTR56_018655 [Elasticomyces elasticus]|nr:hypothetical protein LTR56_018655 [Elasticomyces elasticus]KAK3635666.1 hypothetical protein LTR22_019093 [Elasticomyces elasticus]KAK5764009.1 hypothetical protein LTS12_005919 [Elasticomyces elasticus]